MQSLLMVLAVLSAMNTTGPALAKADLVQDLLAGQNDRTELSLSDAKPDLLLPGSLDTRSEILLATKASSSETASSDNANSDAASPASDKKKTSSESKNPSATQDKSAENEKGKKSFSGNVSWYGIPFHGKKTASGEIFNMNKCSAAHLTLPLPTKALVEDPRTGNAVIVKVNDRGPFVKTRVMDLSREAARQLGTLPRGVAYVEVTVIESPIKRKTQ